MCGAYPKKNTADLIVSLGDVRPWQRASTTRTSKHDTAGTRLVAFECATFERKVKSGVCAESRIFELRRQPCSQEVYLNRRFMAHKN